jgi:CxxC motif-containing protein
MRSLTSTVKVKGGIMPLVSVRSDIPVPREKISEAVNALKKYELAAPVEFHQVVVNDILGTGANIIATKQVLKA